MKNSSRISEGDPREHLKFRALATPFFRPFFLGFRNWGTHRTSFYLWFPKNVFYIQSLQEVVRTQNFPWNCLGNEVPRNCICRPPRVVYLNDCNEVDIVLSVSKQDNIPTLSFGVVFNCSYHPKTLLIEATALISNRLDGLTGSADSPSPYRVPGLSNNTGAHISLSRVT